LPVVVPRPTQRCPVRRGDLPRQSLIIRLSTGVGTQFEEYLDHFEVTTGDRGGVQSRSVMVTERETERGGGRTASGRFAPRARRAWDRADRRRRTVVWSAVLKLADATPAWAATPLWR